jgi:hypothetical protein
VLERQQRIVERLLDGAAAALPTANLEQVKAGSLELDLCRIKSLLWSFSTL